MFLRLRFDDTELRDRLNCGNEELHDRETGFGDRFLKKSDWRVKAEADDETHEAAIRG